MPRINRRHYKYAYYHVIARGNFRQPIFDEPSDYLKFYDFLDIATKKFDCEVHLFCLMTNHIHLVIQVKTIPLAKIMQSLLSNYSRYYNKKHHQQGHLFQGRYKEKIIFDNEYFKTLIFYIHQNPISANMVRNLDDYSWSSHQCYTNKINLNWLSKTAVLGILKKEHNSPSYSEFMATCQSNSSLQPLDFTLPGTLKIESTNENRLQTELLLNLSNFTINEIIYFISEHLGINIDKISSVSQEPKICQARSLITYFAHYHAGYTLLSIALFLDREPDSISKTMHRNLANSQFKSDIEKLTHHFQRKIKK